MTRDNPVIDITGAHEMVEILAGDGLSLREVDVEFVESLATGYGWAPADVLAAEAWVDPVLARVGRGERLAPMSSATMVVIGPVADDLELRAEWAGGPYLRACVRWLRTAGSDGWTSYARVAFPADSDGLHRIDFRSELFDAMVGLWVERQFDAARARRKLEAAGMQAG